MILLYTEASPFARKCRLCIAELGAGQDIALRDVGAVSPLAANAAASAQAPLGKIPVLVRPGQAALYDSPVICEYLDAVWQGSLFPADGEARWRALALQALADGAMETAVALRYEAVFRGNGSGDDPWVVRQTARLTSAVDAMARAVADFAPAPTIGELSVASALGYLDLRFEEIAWRRGQAALAAWFDSFAARPSMQSTAPTL
ncbi:glutathione S-transferase [Pyruvatibacter mobilis]|uniref:Glutathione S-transferase n=1 Tax=Pyruvatibacter mobilis TaxID=1712261 RepID=A0A845Q973_9HYPH|nr:glutathione S-transferase family protein [Pyruvatibacter mobilis]NBG95193.1 glutathione S-transferase [Pyruvatibacter mobilis]QJD76372.1 glutathione S-transferase family protein [Pyruvatibacter mobilis]GGD23505.1 glutathione S-transferase [Pyruvatibacter mobilis]